jgi:hypothetical protein
MSDRARRAARDGDDVDGSRISLPDAASRPRGAAPGVSALLDLQGSVGNRAVGEMLTAQRDTANFTLMQGGDDQQSSKADTADPTQSPMYQGGPLFPGPTQSPMFTGEPQSKAAPSVPLSPGERSELTRFTGDRIGRAFTAFVAAAEQNRAAVKAAAADSPDFASLLLEICLGSLLPGISKGIANLAAELPATASSTAYRVALAAMNEERTTKLLETGVKAGREYLKGGAKLEGETEIDTFLNTLEEQFNIGADKVDKNLPTLSDEALGVTCAMYDPAVAGQNQFRSAIRVLVEKYHQQVEPIGTTIYHWGNSQSHFSLYWVVPPKGAKRLALLEDATFRQWISPELKEVAMKKFEESPTGRYYQGKVPEIRAEQVDDLKG